MSKKPAVKKPVAKKPVVKPAAKAAPGLKLGPDVKELCLAVGRIQPTAGEAPEKFAERLCTKVSELTDEQYGKLSAGAQRWFEHAAEQINSGKSVVVFGATAATPAAKPAAKAKPTPAGSNGGGKTPRAEGVAHRVRSLVVDAPDIAFDTVAKKVGVEAQIGGHAWNIYNEAKRVMELVQARS